MEKRLWLNHNELNAIRRKACTSHKIHTCAPAQAHDRIYDVTATTWDPVWVRLDRDLTHVGLVT